VGDYTKNLLSVYWERLGNSGRPAQFGQAFFFLFLDCSYASARQTFLPIFVIFYIFKGNASVSHGVDLVNGYKIVEN
jgi:hypothetical protein